ncbi:hypothetical protein EVA_15426 [gut metagenome]|uniref:Uncharacterized protein n=1 Tax=gut metagenome TaxID=749906 RepID=J9FPR7_9ZZZZ
MKDVFSPKLYLPRKHNRPDSAPDDSWPQLHSDNKVPDIRNLWNPNVLSLYNLPDAHAMKRHQNLHRSAASSVNFWKMHDNNQMQMLFELHPEYLQNNVQTGKIP